MTNSELEKLIGMTIGEWLLTELLGSGKSAGVFRGVRGAEVAAVKVFDPALVEEFGKLSQLNRIERELTLRGRYHTNLVKIFDGGECKVTGNLYVVMELLEAPNLSSVLSKVPRERIRLIISQVAAAARYLLEDLDIVHRDIKPDNITVDTEFLNSTLLDLGVIRPLDVSKLVESSDGQRQSFVGTLRYSPPEYLFRIEKPDREGYRAMTFYQLGAVLYDLITRERLFLASSPYARLVKSVESEIPKIHQPDVPQDLIWLANNCLLKNPEHRLSFVSWEDFEQPRIVDSSSAARQRVRRRFGSSLEPTMEVPEIRAADWSNARALTAVRQLITTALKDICAGDRMFPRSTTRELADAIEPSSIDVQLLFEAAPGLQISEPLSILVTTKLVDIEPELIEIHVRAMACYEDTPQALLELRTSKASTVFSGVLDKAMVCNSLEDVIFRVIDIVQSSGTNVIEFQLEV